MVYTDNTNKPFFLGGGDRIVRSDETIKQIAGRGTTELVPFTVMAKDVDGKWHPLGDVDVVQTSAYLTGDTLTGNLAAWNSDGGGVTDGEFAITVDGEEIEVTGLDFSSIASLPEIANVINSHASVAGKFRVVDVDGVGGSFRFESLKKGVPNSSITVLSAVDGGSGTDISGTTTVGLSADTGNGTVTAATGNNYTTVPAGIYIGTSIDGADLVSGDVTGKQILVGGAFVYVDENQLVFENSQALTSTIKVNGIFKTVEDYLVNELGVIAIDSVAMDAQEND